MRQRQRLRQHVQRELGGGRVVLLVQPRLEHLQVPVAQLRVDEAVQRARRAVELELGDRVRDLGLGGLQPRQDPRVLDRRPARDRVRDGPRPSGTRSSTSREALKSLLASWRPSAIVPSLKRTSCVEDIASRP